MSGVAANYFDGRTARAVPVQARFDADGSLELSAADGTVRRFAAHEVQIESRLGNAHRLIRLPDDQHCEVSANDELDAALAAAGRSGRSKWLHRLESSWRLVVVGLLVLVLGTIAVVRWGLPWAAERLAYSLPIEVNEQIGREALALLDQVAFKPSALPPERQDALRAAFRDFLTRNGDTYPYRVQFRGAPKLGANALAFPSGEIVLTDELVKLAADDRELVAVFAHECGHIQRRHGLRTVLQNSAVVLLFSLISGDISSVTALGSALPTLMLQSKYSRVFEAEADQHAIVSLQRAGIKPRYLSDLLEKLEANRPEQAVDGKWLDYVRSHPPTPERIRAIRGDR